MTGYEYVGWHYSMGEGMRYYFSIELNVPYTAIGGREVRRLFLYTSSGTNTGSVCRSTLCILPCFGVANYIRHAGNGEPSLLDNADIVNKEIQCNIIKSDYFTSTRYYVSALYGETVYTQLFNRYFSGNVSDDLMTQYFGNEYTRNDMRYLDFKKKMGCNLFMENVLRYKNQIIAHVAALNATPEINREGRLLNLYVLNDRIRSDTFFGMDLKDAASIGQTKINTIISQFRTSIDNVGRLLDQFRIRNAGDPSRYEGLMRTPYIVNIQDIAYFRLKNQNQGRPPTGLVA